MALQGLHLVTESTPNGQKVQIFLEELAEEYDTKWTTTLMLVFQVSQTRYIFDNNTAIMK